MARCKNVFLEKGDKDFTNLFITAKIICMIKVNYNQLFLTKKYDYDTQSLVTDIEKIYGVVDKKLSSTQSFTVNISFVGQKKIRELNKYYRSVDRVTDVLSFPLVEDFEDLEKEKDNLGYIDLGDVVINLQRAKSQSIEYNHSFRREICFLCLHGLLHLLGYDHIKNEDEKIMFSLQNEILQIVGIGR